MKKFLLIMGLVATVAMTGGAVTVEWTYESPDNAETSVALVYFADSNKVLSESDFDASGNLTSGSLASEGDVNEGGGVYTADSLPSSGCYYIVLFNSGDKSASWSDKITTSQMAAYDQDNTGPSGGFIGTGGNSLGSAGSGITFGGWQAVPEPTSVALLLLGVAAFGCKRRKFAL